MKGNIQNDFIKFLLNALLEQLNRGKATSVLLTQKEFLVEKISGIFQKHDFKCRGV